MPRFPPDIGRLVLVVGPSGSGKDTLLSAARQHFGPDRFIDFPTRTITRPVNAGGETHRAVNIAEFEGMVKTDAFALHWQANGLRYGVPAGISKALEAGKDVVVNVSRMVLDEAREKFPGVAIVSLVVSPDVLAQRLTSRGRESYADIQERLARAHISRPAGPDIFEIDNSSELASAKARFIRTLESLRASGQREAAE